MVGSERTAFASLRSCAPLLLLCLCGILVLLFVTRGGIGVSPDSTVYIGAARNLVGGRGLTALAGRSASAEPLTHYPPLYPVLLALLGWLCGDPLHVARWMGAFVFGLNILLGGLAVRFYAGGRSCMAAALCSLLVLAAPDLLEIHSMAWTEPPFILFCLAGLVLLAAYFEHRGRRALLLLSAASIALCFLTRYVGIVAVACGAFAILIFGAKGRAGKLRDAALFILTACLPMGLWMMRNRLMAGGVTDRQMVFHPVGWRQLGSALSTISTWLLLGKVRTGTRAAVFLAEVALLVIAYALLSRRVDAGDEKDKEGATANDGPTNDGPTLAKLPALLVIFIIFYLGFLIVTASLIDFDTVFDDRALAPVHLLGLVLALCIAQRLVTRAGRAGRYIRLAALILSVTFACSYLIRGFNWTRQKSGDGQGYTARAWRESPTIERIRSLPVETPIFSNGYDAVYFLAGRPSVYLPEKVKHGTGQANALYLSELAHMRDELLSRNGVVVYFDGFPERSFLPTEEELRERLGLRLVWREADGAIYRAER